MRVPTIKVAHPDNPGEAMIINEADFDPSQHQAWSDTPPSSLPEGFPGRDDLAKAGIVDLDGVRAAKDLTAIEGIGKATAAKIAESLAKAGAAE